MSMKFDLPRIFAAFRPRGGEDATRVLALTCSERDRRDLEEIASRNRWRLSLAHSSAQAVERLKSEPIGVVLCDRDIPGADWRELMKVLRCCSPNSCVILISGVNDDYLWEEVIRMGGYDVIQKPFQEPQILPAVTLAWSYWKRYAPTK